MTPETRDFLASVRRAEDPTPSDERRVLAALQTIVTGTLASAATGDAPAPKGMLSAASSGLKVVGALLGGSVGAALVAAAVSSGPAPPTHWSRSNRAAVADAVARASAAVVPSTTPAKSAAATSSLAAPPSAPHISRPPSLSPSASRSASLREELALLADVQSALERGDGAEALRRLDGYATSDRQFIAERRAARIAALCRLGRVTEARDLAALFFRENGQSVQRTAVERSCAATITNLQR
jgi:hypothetical protein